MDYPRLFEKVRQAHGAIISLHAISFSTDWSRMGKADLAHALVHLKIPDHKRHEFIDVFDSDKKDAARQIDTYLQEVAYRRAHVAFRKANNYRLSKAIYLSEAIDGTTEKVLDALWNLFADYESLRETPGGTPEKRDLHDSAKKEKKIVEEQLATLQILIRRELSPSPTPGRKE